MNRALSITSLVVSIAALAAAIFFHPSSAPPSVDPIRVKAMVDAELWHREMVTAEESLHKGISHPEPPDLFLKMLVDDVENCGQTHRAIFRSGPIPPNANPGAKFQFNIGYKF